MSEFLLRLKNEIHINYNNCYPNRDVIPRVSFDVSLRKRIKCFFEKLLPFITFQSREDKFLADIEKEVKISQLEQIYNLLNDQYSKDLFVKLVAMKVLRHRMILPVEKASEWQKYYELDSQLKNAPTVSIEGKKFVLYNLKDYGYNIELYEKVTYAVFMEFIMKQYEYRHTIPKIKVSAGDYVIDGGAYVGDTSLYFAHEAGKEGKVFSFEFLKEGLETMKVNLSKNPKYAPQIQIVQNALWKNSQEKLYVSGSGAGTKVSMQKNGKYNDIVSTLSIDDFVESNKIEKIDFIKLDIEGAELEALYGAKNVITKFKPKLAICIYHDFKHYYSVPEYINSLKLGYKFYVDHFSASEFETILFAEADK
ncbi:MAG: FkbM family methyltransferase [Endomicrobia bacterium]|nr:FkbM family methyltransferase [Endomicrobiia bacterium]MCL2506449.1 FkbM family methyltransferase [Endomicrobiia bacterium]